MVGGVIHMWTNQVDLAFFVGLGAQRPSPDELVRRLILYSSAAFQTEIPQGATAP
jgi:hypothetical protein